VCSLSLIYCLTSFFFSPQFLHLLAKLFLKELIAQCWQQKLWSMVHLVLPTLLQPPRQPLLQPWDGRWPIRCQVKTPTPVRDWLGTVWVTAGTPGQETTGFLHCASPEGSDVLVPTRQRLDLNFFLLGEAIRSDTLSEVGNQWGFFDVDKICCFEPSLWN
jgi:hypothetical protein